MDIQRLNAFSRDYEHGDRLCCPIHLEVRTLYDSNLYLDTVTMIPIENNSWDYVQRIIDREISSAFKLKETMEDNLKTQKLDASDYHKDHPYMKSLDKALKQYSVVKVNDANGAHHGPDYEEMRIAILNSLFHPQAVYDKRAESPNKR